MKTSSKSFRDYNPLLILIGSILLGLVCLFISAFLVACSPLIAAYWFFKHRKPKPKQTFGVLPPVDTGVNGERMCIPLSFRAKN